VLDGAGDADEGETVLSVCPTWKAWGYQPASVTARDAPTAAPRASASCSTSLKPSAEPVPRPPETTVNTPDPVLTASRPATSLPSVVPATSTAAGDFSVTSRESSSAADATG
jgi:hypothetical protein